MTSELEWRRRWKPTLKAKPWLPFQIADKKFLIKSLFTDSSFSIIVTDMSSVWCEDMEEDAIKKRTKKLNPSVEAPVSKLLDHIRSNMDEQRKSTQYSVSLKPLEDSDDERIILTVETKLAGLPFVWKFLGMPADKQMVADHLTVPLLSMVSELTRRQQELHTLLRNKDREIDDLKSQGVKVTRKHLETPVFDESVFNTNMSMSKGLEGEVQILGQSAFSPTNRDLYQQIMTKHEWVHRGPHEDMEGESLMDDGDASVAAGGPTVPSWGARLPPSMGPSTSPQKSPIKSPVKSPGKAVSSPEPSPAKDSELLRRQALERKLQQEAEKKEQKSKKKKKMKF